MKPREHQETKNYNEIGKYIPDVLQKSKKEIQHEEKLFDMLKKK